MGKDNDITQITGQKLEKIISNLSKKHDESFASSFIIILDDVFNSSRFWELAGDEDREEDLDTYRKEGIIYSDKDEFKPELETILMDLLYNEYHRGLDDSGKDYDYKSEQIKILHNALHSAYENSNHKTTISDDNISKIIKGFDIEVFFESSDGQFTLEQDIIDLIGEIDKPLGEYIKGDC